MSDNSRGATCTSNSRSAQYTFANEAFEHYEIAAYKALLTLADAAGVQAASSDLRQSLAEEERMAEWIDSDIRDITMSDLAREERRAA